MLVYKIERPADHVAYEAIAQHGVTITIKGPRQMSKSSLLLQVVHTMPHPDCIQTDHSSLRLGLLSAGLASSASVARQAQCLRCPTVSGWGITEVGVGAALGYHPEAAGAPAILGGGRLKSDFVFPTKFFLRIGTPIPIR